MLQYGNIGVFVVFRGHTRLRKKFISLFDVTGTFHFLVYNTKMYDVPVEAICFFSACVIDQIALRQGR